MQIKVIGNSLMIMGNIKSVNDFTQLKDEISEITMSYKNIILDIKDSFSITSSIIGYLNKLIKKDGIGVQMKVGTTQLFDLLSDLNLISLFNVEKG